MKVWDLGLGLRSKRKDMSEKEKDAGLVDVEVDLDDEVLLRLALEAHRKDITLNQLINESLKSFIEQGIEAQ